ncbi:hypothetical protein Ddye_025148 [Dipteronia dyeriana]|uniref:Uncharacterized protein n=1 Tax=Dipteronia dyeriana TaxID=168575 RepID=A0AAD9TW67_9ROSI|nr:hypothetical protein Ddye_025148 [Dipteronia dyeriana]
MPPPSLPFFSVLSCSSVANATGPPPSLPPIKTAQEGANEATKTLNKGIFELDKALSLTAELEKQNKKFVEDLIAAKAKIVALSSRQQKRVPAGGEHKSPKLKDVQKIIANKLEHSIFYHSLTNEEVRKDHQCPVNHDKPTAFSAHSSIVGEIQNRSAHLLVIKADIETKGGSSTVLSRKFLLQLIQI